MKAYQKEFLDFTIASKVLCFGEFELKSGRVSPYFFNSGLFKTGSDLSKLGEFYAQSIIDSGVTFDMVFGPAYKGIPLAVITAAKLYDLHSKDCPYAFNRKEAKDHGEGGNIVGAPLEGKVLIIDDVMSAGTAIREAASIVLAQGAEVAGISISLDRQERGQGKLSAVQQTEVDYGVKVSSIVGFEDVIQHVSSTMKDEGLLIRINAYRERYGV